MKNNPSTDYIAIGQRIRTYRFEASLKAEELGEYLGISRAAVYRLEKGEIVKIDVLDRLSKLLNVSISTLLGIDVEYYERASHFFKRIQQLEEQSSRILAHFNPFSFLLTSPGYLKSLENVLAESYAEKGNEANREEIEQVLHILCERKKNFSNSFPQILSLLSIQEVEKFLHFGFIGSLNISPSKKQEGILTARKEIQYLIEQLEERGNAAQIAIVNEALPDQTFEILYQGDVPFFLASSPFQLGSFPNICTGIASVTLAPEAIKLHDKMFKKLWDKGVKGPRAIDMLRNILNNY